MYLFSAILYVALFNMLNKKKLDFKSGFLFGLFYFSLFASSLFKFVFKFDFKIFDLFLPIFTIFYYALSMGVYFYLLNLSLRLNYLIKYNPFDLSCGLAQGERGDSSCGLVQGERGDSSCELQGERANVSCSLDQDEHGWQISVLSKARVILLSYLYIIWLIDYSCLIFGKLEGISCANPFIFFMGSFFYRKSLYYLGFNFFIIFFLTIFCLVSNSLRLSAICFFCMLFLDFYFTQDLKKPDWLNNIACAHIEKDYLQENDIEYISCKIKEQLLKIKNSSSYVRCIIMPESTCAFNLNYCPSIMQILQDNINENLILGAHRVCDNGAVYNTAYMIGKDGILNFYDKKHRMFWVERMPFSITSGLFVNSLLNLSSIRVFDENLNQEIVEFDIVDQKFLPCICSEIFFSQCINYGKPILALVNDSWCFSYMQMVLFYAGIFRAIVNKVDLLYVSYALCNFVSMEGDLFKI